MSDRRALELKNLAHQIGPEQKWFIYRPEIDKLEENGNVVGIRGTGKSVILRWMLWKNANAVYVDFNKAELISTLTNLTYELTRKMIPGHSLLHLPREKIIKDSIETLREHDGLFLFDNIDSAEGTQRDIETFIRETKKLSWVVLSFRKDESEEIPIITLEDPPAEEVKKILEEHGPRGKPITASAERVSPLVLQHLLTIPAMEPLDLNDLSRIFTHTTNWMVVNKVYDLSTVIALSLHPLDERRLAKILDTTTSRVDELLGKIWPFIVEKNTYWGRGYEIISHEFQKHILISAGPIKRREYHKRVANLFNNEGLVFATFFHYRGMKNAKGMLFLVEDAFDEGIYTFPTRLEKCLEWLYKNLPKRDEIRELSIRRRIFDLLHSLQEYERAEELAVSLIRDLEIRYQKAISTREMEFVGAHKEVAKELAMLHAVHARNMWLLGKENESISEIEKAITLTKNVSSDMEFVGRLYLEIAKNYILMSRWKEAIEVLENIKDFWEKKATQAILRQSRDRRLTERIVYTDAMVKALLGIAYVKLGDKETAKPILMKAAGRYTTLINNLRKTQKYINELAEVNSYME